MLQFVPRKFHRIIMFMNNFKLEPSTVLLSNVLCSENEMFLYRSTWRGHTWSKEYHDRKRFPEKRLILLCRYMGYMQIIFFAMGRTTIFCLKTTISQFQIVYLIRFDLQAFRMNFLHPRIIIWIDTDNKTLCSCNCFK